MAVIVINTKCNSDSTYLSFPDLFSRAYTDWPYKCFSNRKMLSTYLTRRSLCIFQLLPFLTGYLDPKLEEKLLTSFLAGKFWRFHH